MYCTRRIPAHLRCTQCSILLHLMDICFLTCICLWQILQIQTSLFKVVGPGLVSTSPAFVSSSASHPSGPPGRHAQKTGRFDTMCTAACVRCDRSTACMLCRLEPCRLRRLEPCRLCRLEPCRVCCLDPCRLCHHDYQLYSYTQLY